MKFIGIIPARYASTRFPGKPLVDIQGKSMIQRVYEQASKALSIVYVATDDERIEQAVLAFGGKVIMTSSKHESGTDRIAEASTLIRQQGIDFDVVVNVQGDEPFIKETQIELIKGCFKNESTQIATLIKPITTGEELSNPNVPKVVVGAKKQAIYFSRSPIPFSRGEGDLDKWCLMHTYYKHIGMYAYTYETLQAITHIPQSPLEITESLEQLRWIENDYEIITEITLEQTISVDTPDDLDKINN